MNLLHRCFDDIVLVADANNLDHRTLFAVMCCTENETEALAAAVVDHKHNKLQSNRLYN